MSDFLRKLSKLKKWTEISLKEQKKLRRRKILKTCVPIAVVSAGAIFALSSIAPSMDRSGLDFITADTGTVEMSGLAPRAKSFRLMK